MAALLGALLHARLRTNVQFHFTAAYRAVSDDIPAVRKELIDALADSLSFLRAVVTLVDVQIVPLEG